MAMMIRLQTSQANDISFFARYRYEDRTDVQLRLRAKSTYSWLPGDYRSREEFGKSLAAGHEA